MIKELKEIVEEVLYRLDAYSDDALTLVMRTGAAESGYRELRGRGEGNPALGFWQVEPKTIVDIWDNFVLYRPHYRNVLLSLGYDEANPKFCILSNIGLQVAFCRLKYLRDSKRIPGWSNIEAQGRYWKRVYNTELGKGTLQHFLSASRIHGLN